jgi:hypothetical protein
VGPCKTTKLRKALLSKGFKKENQHHEMYWYLVGNKRTSVRTRISHGEREYGDPLLGEMAKQLGLKREEFDDLVECPLDELRYREILLQQQRISLESRPHAGIRRIRTRKL